MIVHEDVKLLLKNFHLYFIKKNDQYGNSYFEPVKIFGGGSVDGQLSGRIDIILSRISTSREKDGDIKKKDVVNLVGNLILLMLYKGWLDFDDLSD